MSAIRSRILRSSVAAFAAVALSPLGPVTAGSHERIPDSDYVAIKTIKRSRGGYMSSVWRGAADGTSLSRITGNSTGLGDLTLSHDRTRVAYVRFTKVGHGGLYKLIVRQADGSGRETLVTNDEVLTEAQWSPDGTMISYIHNPPDTGLGDTYGNDYYIRVVDVDTKEDRLLAHGDGPEWSPDGEEIAFTRCNERSPGEACGPHRRSSYGGISSVDVDTGVVTPITRNEKHADPSWSPDGAHIAFDKFPSGGHRASVWRMNSDGTQQERLTDPKRYSAGSPDWSPSGGEIAFVTYNPKTTTHSARVMQADGSNQHRVGGRGTFFVDWSPDGERLIVYRDRGRRYVNLKSSGFGWIWLPKKPLGSWVWSSP